MALDPTMPVLVVDDYSTMVRIIRNLLRAARLRRCRRRQRRPRGIAKMHAKRYGLVISDWNMEPMTGFDLLRQVRADPELGDTPFIMVTAESKTENVIAARKAGVNNYIVKPFNAQTLKAKSRRFSQTPDRASTHCRLEPAHIVHVGARSLSAFWRSGFAATATESCSSPARSPNSCSD